MGKSGDLLRQKKRGSAAYSFTLEQLEERDRRTAERACKQHEAQLMEKVRQEWDRRDAQFKSGGFSDTIMATLELTLAVSLRVLTRDFNWPISPTGGDERYRLNRFAALVVDEFNDISNDELKDIRKYAKEVYDECHIEFTTKDDATA